MERMATIKNVQVTRAELEAALAELNGPSFINNEYVDTGGGGMVRVSPVRDMFGFTPGNALVEISIKGRTENSANFSASSLRKLIEILRGVQNEKGWN